MHNKYFGAKYIEDLVLKNRVLSNSFQNIILFKTLNLHHINYI